VTVGVSPSSGRVIDSDSVDHDMTYYVSTGTLNPAVTHMTTPVIDHGVIRYE